MRLKEQKRGYLARCRSAREDGNRVPFKRECRKRRFNLKTLLQMAK
jgi:hypothetical protein